MSLTALVWILCFLLFVIGGFSKPMWACYAYLLTFFAAPQLWWWGSPLTSITPNWNLLTACFLALSVLINARKFATLGNPNESIWKWCISLLMLYTLNVFVVHYGFAVNPETSWQSADLIVKQLILTFLLYWAIKSKSDLIGFLVAIFIGCTYIGYEAVVNEAGSFVEGRLEGILVPGASNSNGLSALLTFGMLIGGWLFINYRSIVLRIGIVFGCVLILDTLLRCNSRGAFLGLICGGVWMLIAAKGTARKRLIGLSLIGVLAILMQAGDKFIWERFDTTFSATEERDGSANSRIEFWKAAGEMIADHPFGSGGGAAFRSQLGMTYIEHLKQGSQRAVHNGYLDIAAGWGVQGFAMLASSLVIAFVAVWRVTRSQNIDATEIVLLGSLIQGAFVAQLVATIFLSRLDHEVFNWLIVLCVAYCREYGPTTRIRVRSDDDFVRLAGTPPS